MAKKYTTPHRGLKVWSEKSQKRYVLFNCINIFSPNEIYAWPKPYRSKEPMSTQPGSQKYVDPSRNIVFLRDSCQIVKPVSPRDLPAEFTKDNFGLASPGNVAAFLEVVDLADSKLR